MSGLRDVIRVPKSGAGRGGSVRNVYPSTESSDDSRDHLGVLGARPLCRRLITFISAGAKRDQVRVGAGGT